jgi:hypothetical protein
MGPPVGALKGTSTLTFTGSSRTLVHSATSTLIVGLNSKYHKTTSNETLGERTARLVSSFVYVLRALAVAEYCQLCILH